MNMFEIINNKKEVLSYYFYYGLFKFFHFVYGFFIALVILFVNKIHHLAIVQVLLSLNILFYYLLDGCPLTTIESYYLEKADDTQKEKIKKIGKIKDKKILLEKKSGIKRLIFSYVMVAIKIMFIMIFFKG